MKPSSASSPPGLLAPAWRAIRPLAPESDESAPAPLSAIEQARIAALREQTARRLKAARALGEAELAEEARPPLLEAIHLRARALAVSHRLPEPENLTAAFQPPLTLHFGASLPVLHSFVTETTSDWRPAAEALLASEV